MSTKNGFNKISNIILNDHNLSLKDKGLLCHIISRPNDWDFSKEGMAKILPDGITSISNTIKHLVEHKYITYDGQHKDAKGKVKPIIQVLNNPTDKNFTKIPNQILWDRRLGMKELGLICYITSLPPTWKFSLQGLIAKLPEGKDAIRDSLKKLNELGYIHYSGNARSSTGKFGSSLTKESCNDTVVGIDIRDGKPVAENPRRLISSETAKSGKTGAEEPRRETSDNIINHSPIFTNGSSSKVFLSINNNKGSKEPKDNRMMDKNIDVFIKATKKRISYNDIAALINDEEMMYLDRIVNIIALYTSSPELHNTVKIAGAYVSDLNPHLFKYKKAEVYHVILNMSNLNAPVDKLDSYYLTALDQQLKLLNPLNYATINDTSDWDKVYENLPDIPEDELPESEPGKKAM